jgi:viroplasmin and RNaseH domain-containing protein
MAKKNHYAIKKGRESNVIVGSWYECRKLTDGYPGAIFKGFTNEHEAIDFLALGQAYWIKSKKTNKRKKGKSRCYTINGVRFQDYGTTTGELYVKSDDGSLPF